MLWKIRKTVDVAASHKLDLPYDSKCNNQHGHNYKIMVTVCGRSLNEQRMLVDYSEIGNIVNYLDHQDITPVIIRWTEENLGDKNGQPTAELISATLAMKIQKRLDASIPGNQAWVSEVYVAETGGNEAWFYPMEV